MHYHHQKLAVDRGEMGNYDTLCRMLRRYGLQQANYISKTIS